MSAAVIKRSRAYVDLAEIAEYIARDNQEAAGRFLDAAEETFDLLLDNPGIGTRKEFEHPRLEVIRVFPVRGFRNYLVFYKPVAEGIEIIRVIHGARDIEALFGA